MNQQTIILFFPRVNTDMTRFMPYSVLHLERMIRDRGLDIVVVDEQVTPDYDEILLKHKGRIFATALTAATGFQLNGAIKFSKKIKDIEPLAPTIWCGWHTSLLPEITLKEDYIDFVISGQSENTFRELIIALQNKSSYQQLPGLGFKEENAYHFTPQGSFQDINLFPDIDFSLIDPNDYVFQNSFSKRCITYFASHGCPFRCEFCSLATVFGGKWYAKNTQKIINELKYLKEKAQLDGISFWDDNFFTQKNNTLNLVQSFIANKLDLKWECCSHAGLFNKMFNDEDIDLLVQSGLRQIFIGAESGDDDILKLVSKHIESKDNLLFVSKIKKFPIAPVFLIIVGFPVNPDKDLKATLNMIRQAKIINKKLKIRMHIFIPVPKTKMYEVALNKGLIMPNNLRDYTTFLYDFNPPWIKKNYNWTLETFANFYMPLSNPLLFKDAPGVLYKLMILCVSILFFPAAWLRMRFNFFRAPIGAYVFLSALFVFNRIFKTNLSLATETFLGKNKLGFYNSYCG